MPSWMTKAALCLPAVLPTMVLGTLLTACTPSDQFPPPCPQLKLLPDAGDVTSFNGRGQDVTDQLLTAHITSMPASCNRGGRGIVNATVNVVMVVDRGPSLPGRSAQIPYFITVMDGGRLLQQKDYLMPVEFPPNVDEGKATSENIDMEFPVTTQKSAATYTIYVGFRLTPDQLTYNRRNAQH